ncbi:hypothetical protein A2U01_0100761 [Trifolium medium]|uniref:Uncharacterized protein n=1 Tax=Trifolium medium TaxID=97028 RepID=A0A392UZC5_9FABA|nr:hypothetical protein [Trifolium medium]
MKREEEILLEGNPMAVEDEGSWMKVEAVLVRLEAIGIVSSADCRDTASLSARRMTESV